MLYLTCSAWVPVLLSVLLSYLIILIRVDLVDNTGALMICGALVGEVLYFSLLPDWKTKVKHLACDTANSRFSRGENIVYYESLLIPTRYYFDDLKKEIRVQSSTSQLVQYHINSQIDELDLLKNFDSYNYSDTKSIDKVRINECSRVLDLNAAGIIAATLFFGTMLWGFGELLVN